MRPSAEDKWYLPAYARCCRFHRQGFGPAAASVVNFDVVFLYLCCLDAGLVPTSVLGDWDCCRLRWEHRLLESPDAAVGRFCAALSLVLADAKLRDDERDRRIMRTRVGRALLGRPIRRAYAFLTTLDSQFSEKIDCWTREQIALEAASAQQPLADYAAPTVRGVSSVVGLLPGAEARAGLPEFLNAVGRLLAFVVVALDCATDWRDDLRSGHYNPVRNEYDAQFAAAKVLESLDEIYRRTFVAFGTHALAARVCRAARRRVLTIFPSLRPVDVLDDSPHATTAARSAAMCSHQCGCVYAGVSRFFLFVGCPVNAH